MQPPPHDRVDSRPLNEAQIETLLRNVPSEMPSDVSSDSPLTNDFRISIAGAQEKTALLRIGKRWHLPLGATPTTHIFKLPLGLVGNITADMSDSIENEWLCAKILDALGFDVAPTEIGQFGDQKVLIVERFERRWIAATPQSKPWIARLPQDDFCQATGKPGDIKYETDGGPGIRAALGLLAGGSNAQQDSLRKVACPTPSTT